MDICGADTMTYGCLEVGDFHAQPELRLLRQPGDAELEIDNLTSCQIKAWDARETHVGLFGKLSAGLVVFWENIR
jgi:hypothetical protein